MFLLLVTMLNGGSLFNKKNGETERTKSPVVTHPEEEILQEEETVEEETPTPDPNPEPTPDTEPTPDSGNSDIGLESETE